MRFISGKLKRPIFKKRTIASILEFEERRRTSASAMKHWTGGARELDDQLAIPEGTQVLIRRRANALLMHNA